MVVGLTGDPPEMHCLGVSHHEKGELKATCLSCDSEKFVSVVNLNVDNVGYSIAPHGRSVQ